MSLLESIVLGIVQGLTEFLPISSSGHLVLFQYLLGLREPMLAFDVLLHMGTLVAVTWYYRQRLWNIGVSVVAPSRYPEGRRLLVLLIAATIPTAVLGYLLEDFFERMFADTFSVGWSWILTGVLLLWALRFRGTKTLTGISILDAVLIGIFQAISIIPAISRSGATIFIGMARGMAPADAADFSFLLSIPAILGAMILKMSDLAGVSLAEMWIYVWGVLASFVFGYLSIWALIRLLKRRVIKPFAWYCIVLGAFTMVLFLING